MSKALAISLVLVAAALIYNAACLPRYQILESGSGLLRLDVRSGVVETCKVSSNAARDAAVVSC